MKLKISGDIELEIFFQELDYDIKEDILKFRDKNSNNYISINLNNINFMAKDNDRIVCTFNDNSDTVMEIYFM